MHTFHVAVGRLFVLGLAALFLAGSGPAANTIGMALTVLLLAATIVTAASFLIRMVLALAQNLARDLVKAATSSGPPVGRLEWQTTAAPPGEAAVIERWCRQAGWLLVGREGDDYRIRSDDHRMHVYVTVSYSPRFANVLFQAVFPVRFPLEAAASGVFARITMRNQRLAWCAWHTQIGGRCEAWPGLASSMPFRGVDGPLFAKVCEEMAGELRSFYQELHDRFAYTLPSSPPAPATRPVQTTVRIVPDDTGIRYLEDRRGHRP